METTAFRFARMTVAMFLAGAAVWAQRPAQVALKELAAQPSRRLKTTVQVTGILENQGTNYFSDLRVVLKDAEGGFIHVRPWLPLSLPPRPPAPQAPSGPGKRPDVLSDFLGKRVELTGVVEKGNLRRAGEVYYLEVQAARLAGVGEGRKIEPPTGPRKK